MHKQWEHPETRQALLNQLEREGFAEEKLRMVQRVIGREDCDLLDVLDFLAYETTPIERARRVELVRQDYYQTQSPAQQKFLDFLMQKTMIFIYVSSNRIQHELFVDFLCRAMIKSAEVFIFFDIPKVSLRLNGTNLTIKNSFLTFYICMGFFLQFLPQPIYLHDFIFISVRFIIVFI